MPEDLPYIPHDRILRFEEILRVCGIAAGIGIRTIKVTGGEPLVRKGCVGFLRDLKALPGVDNVTLTTNAVLLEPHVEALSEMGFGGVNISLDSLDTLTFQRLTGCDDFARVWKSLLKSIEAGLRVKINFVPLRNVNDSEIIRVARLAGEFPIDVRFIELMPATSAGQFVMVTGKEILTLLRNEYPDLNSDETRRGFGPAHYFNSGSLKGSVGIIDAVSNHFCKNCNRVRLTSEGFLKLCLFHDDGLDLRAMLRSGANDADIEKALVDTIHYKPERYSIGDEAGHCAGIKRMSRIGG